MSYRRHVWDQVKNITAEALMKALERDGWVQDEKVGSDFAYRHPDGRRVTIHYHPRKTYGPGLLRALLKDIGWTEEDMRRLRIIK